VTIGSTRGGCDHMERGTRDDLLDRLVDVVESVAVGHPTRVAVDGAPASGKTTLADHLAVVLRARGRQVIRATIDEFMFVRAQRYRRGEYSAEGCYFDSHDCDTLKRVLLDPLGPDGSRLFRPSSYHRATDSLLLPPATVAAVDAVLLFDGVFLMRPELNDRWDLRIFVATSFEETVKRALLREKGSSSADDIERRWRERYIPAQKHYFASVHPIDRAQVLVDNEHPQHPAWECRIP
jgi:uridine kinase